MEEVLARYPRRGVVADGEPRLRAMRLIHIVRCPGSAHARWHPARLQRISEYVRPKAGGGESQDHVVKFAFGISGGARPAPARPGKVFQIGDGAVVHSRS